MARENKRQGMTHFYFEAVLGPNEKLVLPTPEHVRRNGTTTFAIQGPAGTKMQATLIHGQTVAASMPPGQRFNSTVLGDYPADANADKAFRWSAGVTLAADWDIATLDQPATALLITAPAGGGQIVIHGDF